MMIRIYAIGFLVMGAGLSAAPKESVPSPPPPMPQANKVSIFRGRSIDIPLRAVGRAPKTLKFLIRSGPASGTLGPIRSTGLKSAVVTYTHSDSSGDGKDTFTYAVQGLGTPVSAPAKVGIQISEEPPALSVVHALDFGTVMLGETKEEEIRIQNAGGGLLTGEMTVPSPWKILGSPSYRLKRHQERKVRLLFAPEEEREYRHRLGFSHDARSVVELVGGATAPFAFDPPAEIALEASGTDPIRAATLRIRNLTAADRTIELDPPEGLQVKETLFLPAGAEEEIHLQTKNDFPDSHDGLLNLTSEGFRRTISLRVFARQALLAFVPEDHLDFGKIEPGRRYKLALAVKNIGGSDARLQGSVPPDIQLLPPPDSLVLAPDETRVFEVALESRKLGAYRDLIEIGVEGRPSRKVSVTATVGGGSPTAAKVSTAALAPKGSPSSGHGTPPETPPEAANAPIPAIENFTLRVLSERAVDVVWARPPGDVSGYLIEQRTLEVVPGGPPKILWKERRGMKFLDEGELSIARFENLAPGQTWFMRVRAIAPDGRLSPPSPTFRMVSPLPPRGFGPRTVFVILFLVLAGFVGRWIYRRRQAGAAREAVRLSRLEKDA